jgi:hypothetical protein
MRHIDPPVPNSARPDAGAQPIAVAATATAFAAAFAFFIWLDIVLPPAATFAISAVAALAWCGWLEMRQ